MDEMNNWLKDTRARCMQLSEAYRLELSRLWWANLMFVVLPAVCSTAAAIVATIEVGDLPEPFSKWVLPPASILAAGA